MDEIAPRVVGMANKGSAYTYDVQNAMSERKSRLPLVGRLAISQLLKKIPLLEKLVETIEGLDASSLQDESTFKASVKSSMKPYLEKTSI